MAKYTSKLVIIIVTFILLSQLFNCTVPPPKLMLSPTDQQTPHNTEFVLVNHPPVSFHWRDWEYPYEQVEIKRNDLDSLLRKVFGTRAEEQLTYELDMAESYLSGLPNLTRLTNTIYFKSFDNAFSENSMINLQPYSGPGVINKFEHVENADSLLSYIIPVMKDSTIPDWYLVLNVQSIRLTNTAPNTNIGLLTKALHSSFEGTALEENLFEARIKYHLLIVDSKTRKILFDCYKYASKKINNSSYLSKLVEHNKDTWPEEFINIIVHSASSDAASILHNRQIFAWEDISKEYALTQEEIEQILRELSLNK